MHLTVKYVTLSERFGNIVAQFTKCCIVVSVNLRTIGNHSCRPFILSNAVVQSFGFPSTWKELRHFEDHPQATTREALSQTYGGYV